mmetsp:Transcript_88887/g.176805  ORF Transcript_88887/g.176805 Transcript_88887/m.176805 type:complete len:139 (-) Transcript_88887:283-699(-)
MLQSLLWKPVPKAAFSFLKTKPSRPGTSKPAGQGQSKRGGSAGWRWSVDIPLNVWGQKLPKQPEAAFKKAVAATAMLGPLGESVLVSGHSCRQAPHFTFQLDHAFAVKGKGAMLRFGSTCCCMGGALLCKKPLAFPFF